MAPPRSLRAPVVVFLRRLALAFPRVSLALVARLSPVDAWGLRADELSALLGTPPDGGWEPVRRRIAAQERRNALLFHLVGLRGMQSLWPLVEVRDEGGLDAVREGPAVLVLWHAGVPLVELPGLAKLDVPAVVATPANPFRPVPKIRFYGIHGSPAGRLQFLRHGLACLREESGSVIFFLDRPVGDAGAEVEFLGRPLRLGRGAASLARMSRAHVVPVTSAWADDSGSDVVVSYHEPLPLPEVPRKARIAWEDALLAEAARWFEAYLRRHPERLRARYARNWIAGIQDSGAPE